MMNLVRFFRLVEIAYKFLQENEIYTGFDKDDCDEDVRQVLENTFLLEQWGKEYKKPNDKWRSDWQCPICYYSGFPDWSPNDFYIADNLEIYPKCKNFGDCYDHHSAVSYQMWDQTERCPVCKKDFTFQNASA